jgi:hypothetical protein
MLTRRPARISAARMTRPASATVPARETARIDLDRPVLPGRKPANGHRSAQDVRIPRAHSLEFGNTITTPWRKP